MLLSHSCVSILISGCHANLKATQMINKMESSCCHGNSKRSGQAQTCAENGLIGKDTDDWGLNHEGLTVPPLRVLARGGRRSSVRMQHRAAQLSCGCRSPPRCQPAALLWGMQRRGSSSARGQQEGRGEMFLVMGTAEVAQH